MKMPALSFGPYKPERAAGIPAQHRADDAEQHRDDDAAGIFAGHQQLGDHADDKSKNNPPENAEHTNTSARLLHKRSIDGSIVHGQWSMGKVDGRHESGIS